tara:strand:+ start:18276 stop:19412 length:1137 start_codon:yes stop_codon:yes gene_type:complete
VLQLVTPGAASAVSAQDSEARPAHLNAAQADSVPSPLGLGELFASELQAVGEQQATLLEGLEPGAEVSTEALPEAADSAQAAPELDAEQWLLSMLGQRDVQVQARDTPPAASLGPAGVVASGAERGETSAWLAGAGLPVARALGHADSARGVLNDQAAELPARQVGAADSARLPVLLSKAEALLPTPIKPVDGPLLAALDALAGSADAPATETADGLATASSTTLPSSSAGGAERAIRLQGPEAKWGEQMLNALRDNVELQVQQRVQSTTIRLDPPELGSMEIFLSHESGRLNVQITASQADVARLLQSTSERLRQELVGQHFTQVSVGVGSEGRSGQQHSQRDRARFLGEAEVAANHLRDAPVEEKTGFNRDVLITV